MSERARPVGGDERDRPLPTYLRIPRADRRPLFDHYEAGPVLRIVLDRLRQHIQPVAGGRGLGSDRRGPRLALLGHRPCGTRGVVIGDRLDLARVQVAVALGQRLRVRQRPLDRSRPSEQVVTHWMHVLAHHAQSR